MPTGAQAFRKMFSSSSRWIIIFIFISTLAKAQNQIPNPNLEVSVDSGLCSIGFAYRLTSGCGLTIGANPPNSWSVTNLTPDRLYEGTIYCNWDNDTAAFGKAFLVVGHGESAKATLSQPLQVGGVYVISYWAKAETMNGAAGSTSIFMIFFGTPFSNAVQSYSISNIHWQRYTHTFTALANSTEIEFAGWAFNAGTDIDSIALVELQALPVQLSSFEAKVKGGAVLITWSTASQINNDYFDVERSRNNYTFESISKIAGAGNSSSDVIYNTWDFKPWRGVNYYRLRQTDFDGHQSFSGVVAVEIIPVITISNPFADHNILWQELKNFIRK